MLEHIDWLGIGALIHLALAIGVVLRVLQSQRNASVAIAWLAILFALPFIGILLYLLLGETTLGRKYQSRNQQIRALLGAVDFAHADTPLPSAYQGVSRIGTAWTGFHAFYADKARLIDTPDDIFDALIDDINNANTMILMEFYIIHAKGRVLEVLTALENAAQRGVECHILADGVGSVEFFQKHAKTLANTGIYVHESLPVGLFKTLFKRVDLRNHRKIVAIDDKVGYTGSFNLVDPRYFKQDKGFGQWIDMMMRLEDHRTNGVIAALSAIVATDIGAENDKNLTVLTERFHDYTKKLYRLGEIGADGKLTGTPSKTVPIMRIASSLPAVRDVVVQPIPSAPQMTAHVIHSTLVSVIHRANQSVWITTPYFVPDDALLSALTCAAKRGVEVVLIVPKVVDSFLVRHASYAFFEELIEAGVVIAQFGDGLLHTKSVVIDEEYCLFGTVNMDMRSFYLNMEFSLAIYTKPLVMQVLGCQKAYFERADVVGLATWQSRSWGQKLLDNSIRLFGALL
ncbi:cardiolipin synthase [Moraxella caviae]|uniref:Cardiolipin synthase n=1 Tax=Moraxella caviae TaxID=34060 RepID=A0A1T0AC24_9GAMM|nr:cardiolipin synthase [Moraxella caviae]